MIITKCGIAGKSKDRFVRKDHTLPDTYVWCERDPSNLKRDTAQGTCNAKDLPKAILAKCEAYHGYMYACAWPYETK